MSEFDQKEFRNALGMFATGITIVTTTTPEGEPIGMTVNSFASVSLDPPLVLWSVGNHANSYDIFTKTDHFAIHVLRKDQEELSNLFASRGEDKFGGIGWASRRWRRALRRWRPGGPCGARVMTGVRSCG